METAGGVAKLFRPQAQGRYFVVVVVRRSLIGLGEMGLMDGGVQNCNGVGSAGVRVAVSVPSAAQLAR